MGSTMQDYYQLIVNNKSFLPLLETLFLALIFLVIVFQVAWFASLPVFHLQSLASVDFVDWSNYGQFAISFLCTAIAFFLYAAPSRRSFFLLAGFSSGLWFLSNSFWFLYVKIVGRNLLYPGMADIGFLGVFLLLATAISLTFDEKKLPGPVTVAIYGVPLVVSMIAAITNVTGQTLTNIVYCLFSSILLLAVIRHNPNNNRLFFGGVLCYIATMLAYALRETYFPGASLLTIVGQLAMVSFCLIPLGLLRLDQGVSA